MITHKLEEAELVYIVDVIEAKDEPGTLLRYDKDDIMLKQIPLKMSPHQIGIQEMLLVSEMRGHCPGRIFLLGVIPSSTLPGNELSPVLQESLVKLAEKLVSELGDLTGSPIIKKS